MAAKGMNLTATKSLVSQEEIIPLLENFPRFSFRIPDEDELASCPKEGELCIYMEYFAKGLKLPIQDSLSLILNHFAMAPAQLTPNAFEVLLTLETLYADHSLEWSIPNVLSLLTFGRKAGGFYCVMTRHSQELGITGFVTSIKGWRSNFVFVTSPTKWNVPTKPSLISPDTFKWSEMTLPLIKFFEGLKGGSFILLDVGDLCYSIHLSAVKERGDAEAIELGSGSKKSPPKKRKIASISSGKDAAGSNRVVEESLEEDDKPSKKIRKTTKRSCREITPPVVHTEIVSSGSEKTAEESSGTNEEDSSFSGGSEESGTEATDSGSSPTAEDAGVDTSGKPEGQIPKVAEDVSSAKLKAVEESGPSKANLEAPPSKERRMKKKEEKSPLKDGFDEDGYRYDKANRIVSFRCNDNIDILPQWDTFNLPSKLLYGLTSDKDLDYIDSLSHLDILKHGSQLNTGASIYTASLYTRVVNAEKALHAKERANEALRKSQHKTEAELVKTRKELEKANNLSKKSEDQLKEVEKKTLEEINSLRQSLANAETHIDNEKATNDLHVAEIGRLELALKQERDDSRKKTADHDRLLESLKNPPAPVECSLDLAEAIYKKSDRYGDAMNDFGEHGFNLLKEALLKDGRVDQSVLNEFEFEDCIYEELESQKK